MSRQLAELLLKENLITPPQLQAAEEAFRRSKEPVLHYLLRSNAVQEAKILEVFSKRYKIPAFDLSKFTVPEATIQLLSRDDVYKFNLIPVEKAKGTLVVALADPTSLQFLDDVKFRTQLQVEPVITTFTAFERARDKYYGGMMNTAAIEGLRAKQESQEKVEDLMVQQDAVDITDESQIDEPIINLVNQVLVDSVRRKASDIHVEVYEKSFRIRMRVDGVLYEAVRPPREVANAVIARLKIMAKMDIAEKRLPQDGRIKIRTQYGEMDYRTSSMPTVYGEKIVLRLLDKSGLQADLMKLGFEKADLDIFIASIQESYGMVLVTGPTGSGKTTTLYSALQELNKVTDNISTAEDPVEYNLEGVNQVQTHSEIGLNFAATLRAFMRQDPDIILVGEIRDFETAEVAVQAALTGHLVLSTLHTNDAPSTVTRLLNMGIEPFLVTAAVNTVVAQRLIRAICASCKIEVATNVNRLIQLGISQQSAKQMKVYRGAGCDVCGQSGYAGRFAIFEVMKFSQQLRDAVLAGANSIELKKMAIEAGMRTLRMNSLKKVAEGKTSLEEALSSTANDF